MNKAITLSFVWLMLTSSAIAQSQLEKNKAIVHRVLKAYVESDLNTMAELVSKEAGMYFFGEDWGDYNDLINMLKEKRGTGEKMEAEEMVAEGNQVAANWTAQFSGAIFKGIWLVEIEDGKIVEWWFYFRQTKEAVDK